MENCIVTKLKGNPSAKGEYKDFLRIPIMSKGGNIYAQRYYIKYLDTGKCAFIVGNGYFTNTSQADYGTYQGLSNATSKEIASMITDGFYDVYVSLTDLQFFLTQATTTAIPEGVASALDNVDYDRLFVNNPGLTSYYMPSVDKWYQYLKYLKNGDTVQFILPDRSVDEIVQHIIGELGSKVAPVSNGFVFYINSKTAWTYHPGKTALTKDRYLTVTILSEKAYTITGSTNWGVRPYTATCVDGVWTYADN